jgi:hypothetical protein
MNDQLMSRKLITLLADASRRRSHRTLRDGFRWLLFQAFHAWLRSLGPSGTGNISLGHCRERSHQGIYHTANPEEPSVITNQQARGGEGNADTLSLQKPRCPESRITMCSKHLLDFAAAGTADAYMDVVGRDTFKCVSAQAEQAVANFK